jgi:ComF family protein
LPFEIEVPDTALCLDCARRHPPFKTARAVFPYDDFSRHLILAFKHGDRTDLAPTLATWMFRASVDVLKKCDVIVPVPLHWRRLGNRRYNQASLLAYELSKLSAIPVASNILHRTRHTPPQGHLSRMARQNNLKGVFQSRDTCDGKTVLLVDDVLTTGTTIVNCTNCLLNAGAKEVHALTLARVIQAQTQ